MVIIKPAFGSSGQSTIEQSAKRTTYSRDRFERLRDEIHREYKQLEELANSELHGRVDRIRYCLLRTLAYETNNESRELMTNIDGLADFAKKLDECIMQYGIELDKDVGLEEAVRAIQVRY